MAGLGLRSLLLLSFLWNPLHVAAETDATDLRARLAAGDTDIDFRALRLAWAASDAYQPDTQALGEWQRKVGNALASADFARADEEARAWLEIDHANPFAHFGAARAKEGLGEQDKADFHREVAESLLDSLCQRGEGQTPDAPCVAISLTEIHAYLARRRLEPGASHEAECAGGVPCVVFEVREQDSGNLLDLYFDISRPMAARLKAEGQE